MNRTCYGFYFQCSQPQLATHAHSDQPNHKKLTKSSWLAPSLTIHTSHGHVEVWNTTTTHASHTITHALQYNSTYLLAPCQTSFRESENEWAIRDDLSFWLLPRVVDALSIRTGNTDWLINNSENMRNKPMWDVSNTRQECSINLFARQTFQ